MLQAINTKKHREEVFTNLYQSAFPAVAKYVAKMGGTFDEAKDVFQDALVIYYEKILRNAIAIQTTEKAYILGIAKYLWFKTYHNNSDSIPFDIADPDKPDDKPSQYASARLMHYLETAGQKCMEILKAFYYDKLTVTHISEAFGYSGVRSATVQKYKCLEKVRQTIKQKALHYEDFVE